MNKMALFALAMVIAPLGVSAATIATDTGGPYDITSDKLFTGIVVSTANGAGSYGINFFAPAGTSTLATAQAALTFETVNTSFTNLVMSWINGTMLNTLVSGEGVDTLTTTFNTAQPEHQLRFDWTNSDTGAGFRFDVTTEVAPIPLPASFLLLGSAIAGIGALRARRRKSVAAAA